MGEEVDALVLTKEDQDGRLIMSKKRARFEKAWRRIEAAAESGEPVEGTVIEVVKGGLIIDLGVRGFLPASLVDIRRVPNLDEYIGTKIECKVIELNRARNNVVLSRRAVLEEERKEQRQEILDRLQPGLIVEGQISNIVDFGAFVDLNGIDGLIHISELSWSHVNHPSEILSIGDTVAVKVLGYRPRAPADLARPQTDPGRSMAAGRRHVQRRRRARGHGHEGRHVRRVRRDPRRRRGPRAHLRAGAAPRREPARDRLARRRRQGQDPRDRLRAPPPVAERQARRGPGAHAEGAAAGGAGRGRRRSRRPAGAGPQRGRLRGPDAGAAAARAPAPPRARTRASCCRTPPRTPAAEAVEDTAVREVLEAEAADEIAADAEAAGVPSRPSAEAAGRRAGAPSRTQTSRRRAGTWRASRSSV